MLIDANILLYAVDVDSPFHVPALEWLSDALNGERRVAIPWPSVLAFLRIATHPRALRNPLTPAQAWDLVEEWLAVAIVWVPSPGLGYRAILGRLVRDLDLHGNLISDAALVALCVEHGLSVVSADSDFARFPDLTWINPVVRR